MVRRAVETGDAYTDEPDFLLKTHVIEQITRCFINGFRSAGRGIKRDPAGNDPKIGIQWPHLVGSYPGTPSAAGYALDDGTPLNISEKDQQWEVLERTFHF